MFQRIFHLLIVSTIILLVLYLTPIPSHADSPIKVIAQSVESNIHESITFKLQATSTAGKIITAELVIDFFGGFGHPLKDRTVKAVFTRASEVTVQYAADVRRTIVLAFTPISYHWNISDDAGNKLSTPPENAEYTDTAHPWKILADDKVSIYSYDKDEQYAKDTLTAVRAAYDRAAKVLGYTSPSSLRVAVFNTVVDYCAQCPKAGCPTGFLQIDPWASGPGIATVWLANEKFTMDENVTTGIGFGVWANFIVSIWGDINKPTPYPVTNWFIRGVGLVIAIDGSDPRIHRARELAAQNHLMALHVLENTLATLWDFGPDSRAAFEDLDAQTFSLAAFMIERFGADSLGKIVAKQKTEDFPSAFKEVTGLSQDDFELAWRKWLGASDVLPTSIPTESFDFPPTPTYEPTAKP